MLAVRQATVALNGPSPVFYTRGGEYFAIAVSISVEMHFSSAFGKIQPLDLITQTEDWAGFFTKRRQLL